MRAPVYPIAADAVHEWCLIVCVEGHIDFVKAKALNFMDCTHMRRLCITTVRRVARSVAVLNHKLSLPAHVYEVIDACNPINLYFDLDCKRLDAVEESSWLQWCSEATGKIARTSELFLHDNYADVSTDDLDVIVLRGAYPAGQPIAKWSAHIVVKHHGRMFRDSVAVQHAARVVRSMVESQFGHATANMIDMAVYSKYRCGNMHNTHVHGTAGYHTSVCTFMQAVSNCRSHQGSVHGRGHRVAC